MSISIPDDEKLASFVTALRETRRRTSLDPVGGRSTPVTSRTICTSLSEVKSGPEITSRKRLESFAMARSVILFWPFAMVSR